MTYAVDLESNVWSRRKFIVPHRRDTSEGGKDLKTDRDIYEMVANQGSRRVRACMEAVIPGHVVDAAFAECEKTIAAKDAQEPLARRIEGLVHAFEKNHKVTAAQIAGWLKRPVKEMLENEFQQLRSIYFGIQSNVTRIEEHFAPPTVADSLAAGRGRTPDGSAGQPARDNPASTSNVQGSSGGTGGAGLADSARTAAEPPAADRASTGSRGGGSVAQQSRGGAPDERSDGRDSRSAAQDSVNHENGIRGKVDDFAELSEGNAGSRAGSAASEGPTQAHVLERIKGAKSVDEINAINKLVAKLPRDQQKDCRLAAGARVRELQAAGAERPQPSGAEPNVE
jgi:hypothetical protein